MSLPQIDPAVQGLIDMMTATDVTEQTRLVAMATLIGQHITHQILILEKLEQINQGTISINFRLTNLDERDAYR